MKPAFVLYLVTASICITPVLAEERDPVQEERQDGKPPWKDKERPEPEVKNTASGNQELFNDIFGWRESPKPVFKPAKSLVPPPPEIPSASVVTPSTGVGRRLLTESKNYEALTLTERRDLLKWAEASATLIAEVQLDILDRFSLCSVDEANARAAGTLKTLSEPYQVGLGRVRILKLNLQVVIETLKDKKSDDEAIAQAIARYQFRLGETSGLMTDISRDSKVDFHFKFATEWQKLNGFREAWIPESSTEKSRRAILWRMIHGDIGIWVDHHKFVKGRVTPKRQALIEEAVPELLDLRASLGEAPWELSQKEQARIAQRLNRLVNRVSWEYKSIAGNAEECLGKHQEFTEFVLFLGANQDLLVYSGHKLFASPREEEKRRE